MHNDFRNILSTKGWSIANLAYRWDLTPEHLSRLASDPSRRQWWNDAISGLPSLSRIEARNLTQSRLRMRTKRDKTKKLPQQLELPQLSGFRYHHDLVVGAVVMISEALGELTEGMRGKVIATKKLDDHEQYQIDFPVLTDWFDPDTIDRHIVATGE